MNRAELRTLLSTWLDDLQLAYFTPPQMNLWLNLAQRQVQQMLLQAGENWYVKPVETLTVINQADYMLPSDFMVEHRLELVLSGTGVNENRLAITPITINEQDWVPIQSGTPTNYYIKKDRITLSPTPSQQCVLRLYYSPRCVDMTSDSDSPDVPEQFMEYVAILACYDGFIKDDRAPDNLVIKKTRYEELLKQMSDDRLQDQSRQVVTGTDYDSGGFIW